ncbi:hypothetical protein ACERZ8_00725 [Tateyamaria armeniaca]|uniref:Uncharacterized protein n=1 Tax=Tateyamaria armeniaca TaxID=2518930 RepID=A0ABW8US43_9RHOB
MAESLNDLQRTFVQTYLGVSPSSDDTQKVTSMTGLWSDAKDRVDDQLRTLSDRLRKTAIPQVQGVADEVETLLAPLRVQLMAALQNFDASSGDSTAKTAAQKAVGAARAWLDKDARVRAIDTESLEGTGHSRNNPW